MLERFSPSKPAPSRPNPPWGKRIVAGAALLGALGAGFKQRSDARHQDELNASVPDRDHSRATDTQDPVESAFDAQGVRDELWRRWNTGQGDAAALTDHERIQFSQEDALRIGHEVYGEMVAQGDIRHYLGRYPEFNDEISLRLARRFGLPYQGDQEPFLSARSAIRDELERVARHALEGAQLDLRANLTIRAGELMQEAVETAMLINPASGVNMAAHIGDGRLIVESLRQYHSAETDGPSPWRALIPIPNNRPRQASEGLEAAWPWMSSEERRMAIEHVQRAVEMVRAQIEQARTYDVPERDRERITNYLRGLLAEWERLFAGLLP